MTAEKRKRSDYAKMLKQYPDVLRIEQMCEAFGGMSTKTGYKIVPTIFLEPYSIPNTPKLSTSIIEDITKITSDKSISI